MLTVKKYNAQNGFEFENGVIVITRITVNLGYSVEMHHELSEKDGYASNENASSTIQVQAEIYKDKPTYEAGATPVEKVLFDNPHYADDPEHQQEKTLLLTAHVDESITKTIALSRGYELIKQTLTSLEFVE